MTIQVVSHSLPEQVQAPAAENEAKEVKEDKSALAVDETAEQDSAESDPANTEASEEAETEKDESEADDSEQEPEAKDSEKDKPKKKGGFQRRIDKLNARATASQQEAEYWKQQALKGAGEPKADAKVEKPQADQAGKPDPETFDTHTEYVEALTDWKIEQREKASLEKAQKSQLETEHEKLLKTHFDRVNSFREKTTDFMEVLESVDDLPVSPTVQEIIVASENGPELMFELAKNRAEYERINKLPPLAAARELGRIEAKLAASSETKPTTEIKKQTKAPAPIAPVSSKGGSKEKSIFDPELSQAEYERLRAKQRAAS